MTVRIYHNKRCSKSRAALALLRERGIDCETIDYLDTPPDAATLRQWLAQLGIGARGLLRKSEPVYRELGLDDPSLTDDTLIAAMLKHPILLERPIVVANGKIALGRPPEAVLAIL